MRRSTAGGRPSGSGPGAGALRSTSDRVPLARTQLHRTLHGRPIALTELPDPAERHEPPSLMPPYPFEGMQWGMSIDLALCTGCSACMVGSLALEALQTYAPYRATRPTSLCTSTRRCMRCCL